MTRFTRWFAFALLIACVTPVWAISYTVQVVASSDETRATKLRDELSRQGYPAYLLAVPTAQGQVYRIRVGAFANRAAAALFAQTLPRIEGSTPSPALADSVPSGLIPWQVELLGQYDLSTTLVQVFPWSVAEETEFNESDSSEVALEDTETENSDAENAKTENAATRDSSQPTSDNNNNGAENTDAENDSPENTDTENPDSQSTNSDENEATTLEGGTPEYSDEEITPTSLTAIRVQPKDASQQALYKIGDLEFGAWQAVLENNGDIVRVRSQSIWPEDWQNASEAEREQFRETALANVANDLDLSPQQVAPFIFELEDEAPFLVLVERFNPVTQTTERLRAIGQPRFNQDNLGLTSYGPSSFFGENLELALPDTNTIFEPNTNTEPMSDLKGEGWEAKADGAYLSLVVGERTWRAANGQPLWGSGDLLLSLYDNQVLIYRLVEP
ncbi:MAG: SPOR domain-containing protein [Trueperaceae bacterium]